MPHALKIKFNLGFDFIDLEACIGWMKFKILSKQT